MSNKFNYNDELNQWERIDRVQEYRGCTIRTITCHLNYVDASKIRNHREYQVVYPDGRTSLFPIDKRGGNIKELKNLIDRKLNTTNIAR